MLSDHLVEELEANRQLRASKTNRSDDFFQDSSTEGSSDSLAVNRQRSLTFLNEDIASLTKRLNQIKKRERSLSKKKKEITRAEECEKKKGEDEKNSGEDERKRQEDEREKRKEDGREKRKEDVKEKRKEDEGEEWKEDVKKKRKGAGKKVSEEILKGVEGLEEVCSIASKGSSDKNTIVGSVRTKEDGDTIGDLHYLDKEESRGRREDHHRKEELKGITKEGKISKENINKEQNICILGRGAKNFHLDLARRKALKAKKKLGPAVEKIRMTLKQLVALIILVICSIILFRMKFYRV